MKLKCSLGCLLVLCLSGGAHAGRPLSTDDAGTADAGTCELESWFESAGSERAVVAAPTCGLAPGLELGADYTLPHPRRPLRRQAGLTAKWVPEMLRHDTPAGPLALGLSWGAAFERPVGQSWRLASHTLFALATLELGQSWTVHANLGRAHDRASDRNGALLNLALQWTPTERWLGFAELQTSNRSAIFGSTVRTVGARWWLEPERLGLDLTASRDAGGGTRWTIGFGWYGLVP